MDFGGLLILGLLWLVFNVLVGGKGKRAPPGRTRSSPVPAKPPERGDATQREGSRLEGLLREVERAMDQVGGNEPGTARPGRRPPGVGPMGRRSPGPLPRAEEAEERASWEARGSLEDEPEIVSLEHDVARPARAQVSQDDSAEQLVARRIAAADARSGVHTGADHRAFDQRIRQAPADATAVRLPGPEALRRAIVWREVLGPPVSLRDPER